MIIEWTKKIRIYTCRKGRHMIYGQFIPYSLPVFLRNSEDVIERTTHLGLDRARFSPLRVKYYLSQGMFLDFPYALAQKKFNIVLEHNLGCETKFQHRDRGVQEVAEDEIKMLACPQPFCRAAEVRPLALRQEIRQRTELAGKEPFVETGRILFCLPPKH